MERMKAEILDSFRCSKGPIIDLIRNSDGTYRITVLNITRPTESEIIGEWKNAKLNYQD